MVSMHRTLRIRSPLAGMLFAATASALTFPLLPLSEARAASGSNEQPYIPVGTARTKKTVIALPEFTASGGAESVARTLNETVANDLAFMDIFKFLGSAAFPEKSGNLKPENATLTEWSKSGAEFLVKAGVTLEGGNVALEGYLYDTAGNKRVLGKRFVARQADARTLAHTFANNIVNSLTGLPGIFLTKIAMSCERYGRKEIYVMNFDGTDIKQITRHGSIAFGPAWSPDGSKIAYSLFTKHRNIKNIDLFEFDFGSSSYRLISNRKNINSGAAYSPDGRKIALTMNFLGNPEIFTIEPGSGNAVRVTKSLGFDVDPSWSPDGTKMAFVSSRSGPPMIYSMNIGDPPNKATRLTYAGRYNASPSWSPQNNKIAFAGWIDKHFDIFIMNPDGSHIERLTKDQGNNEDPHFSADGNFVAFSSNRTGQKNIYVMNVDGTFVKRLTYGLGNCTSPKWSNPPR